MEQRLFLTPAETAAAVVAAGKRILGQSRGRTFVLSLLAGCYIAFGAHLATVVTQDAAAHVGIGISRLLGGGVFSLGLMLVVVCGAELFTGNNLLVKPALAGGISWRQLAENWLLVLVGNFLGALFMAWLVVATRLWETPPLAEHALRIASAKCQLSFAAAFFRGILCNWLVCLAVCMATAAREMPGRLMACFMPIMAFVASGFEHSVANMFFIPVGLLLADATGQSQAGLSWGSFFVDNLLPVTLGNVLGGVLFVAVAYWYVYLANEA